MEWNVKNAQSRDVERQHLNKILAEIRAAVDSVSSRVGSIGTGGLNIKDIVGEMVSGNTETGISVDYDAVSKVLDFVVSSFLITLTGDVTGQGQVNGLSNVTIPVTIDPALVGIPDAPNDGFAYWRKSLGWEVAGLNLERFRVLSGPGLVSLSTDGTVSARTIQGPASVIVTNGDGDVDNPSLALDGDVLAPGTGFSYATNLSTGAKGWFRPALFESTGVLSGGTLSINAGDNTKFDVAQTVVGQTDYTTNPAAPLRAVTVYGPTTANAVPNLAIIATWVGIQMPAGTLVTQNSPFTPTQRRTIAQLGAVISNGAQLIAVNNLPIVMRAGVNQIGDFMSAVGPINNGNLIGPNGANLQINKAAGQVFKEGANFANNPDDPHNLPLAALTAANFNYRTSTGVQAATTNAIDVTQYESSPGVLSIVGNNNFTVQRIYVFTSNLIRIQYGQTEYPTMAAAEAAIATQPFNTEANIAENGILLAFLIVEKNATALDNPAQAKFIPASKFGGPVGSGGTSITNTDALPEGVVNLYFTDERAQDAVGNNVLDTATVNLTYNDAAGQISADVIPGGIAHNNLASIQDAPNPVANEHYHLNSAQASAVATAVGAGSGFVTIAGTQTITGAKTFNATTTFAGVLGTANTQIRATDASLNSLSTSAGAQPRIQVGATGPDAGTTNNRSGFGMGRFFNDSGAPAVYMVKSRGSAMNDNSVAVLNNDSVCQWFYEASNGTGLTRGARYQIMVDGAPVGATVPMRHQWGTMNAGGTMADRWQIISSGDLLPFADNAYNVGSGSLRVKEYFGAIGTINTSDEREKTERGPLTATELAAASELAADVSVYQWNDAIADKGAEAARLHVGWIAQRVRDVMAAHGLDGFRYGFLCYDEWPEQPEIWNEWDARDEVIDEYGNILEPAIEAGRELVQPYRSAGSLFGLRKDELTAFIIAAQEQRLQALEARMSA